MVTTAVLSLPSNPTVQPTPTRVLDAVHVKLTLPAERLLIGVRVSAEVVLLPGLTVTLSGETLREKSAAAAVKLDTLDHDALRLSPDGGSA